MSATRWRGVSARSRYEGQLVPAASATRVAGATAPSNPALAGRVIDYGPWPARPAHSAAPERSATRNFAAQASPRASHPAFSWPREGSHRGCQASPAVRRTRRAAGRSDEVDPLPAMRATHLAPYPVVHPLPARSDALAHPRAPGGLGDRPAALASGLGPGGRAALDSVAALAADSPCRERRQRAKEGGWRARRVGVAARRKAGLCLGARATCPARRHHHQAVEGGGAECEWHLFRGPARNQAARA